MLTRLSYLFILGAGAGKPYGFPLGDELYQFMCSDLMKLQFKDDHIREMAEGFSKELKRTGGVSIDRYLNINKSNQSLMDMGVLSVAAAIHFHESRSQLKVSFYNTCVGGDWYTYLYQKMIQGLETPEELLKIGKNKISFLTFNYDRSLEHYLFSNLHGLLKNAKVPKETIAAKLAEIPIIHVYGRIGYLPWEKDADITDPLTVSFGADHNLPGEIAMQAQKMIHLIYDERKGSAELEEAKKLISNADRILFLGFGYDGMNLSILGLPNLLRGKIVLGTALNTTENERNQIETKLGFGNVNPESKIIDCDCLRLLRDYLI